MKTFAQSPYWMGSANIPGEWINIFISVPAESPELVPVTAVPKQDIIDSKSFKQWVSTEAQAWLELFVERGTLLNENLVPGDWNDFGKFKLTVSENDVLESQALVGNGPDAFNLQQQSSLQYIQTGEFRLQQANFNKGQIVVVLADEDSEDGFWLAKIKSVNTESTPTVYQLKYLALEIKERGRRGVYREQKQYGEIKHSDILFGSVILRSNNCIPVNDLRHILNVVQNELEISQQQYDTLYAHHV
jgi:hypothetical protein